MLVFGISLTCLSSISIHTGRLCKELGRKGNVRTGLYFQGAHFDRGCALGTKRLSECSAPQIKYLISCSSMTCLLSKVNCQTKSPYKNIILKSEKLSVFFPFQTSSLSQMGIQCVKATISGLLLIPPMLSGKNPMAPKVSLAVKGSFSEVWRDSQWELLVVSTKAGAADICCTRFMQLLFAAAMWAVRCISHVFSICIPAR